MASRYYEALAFCAQHYVDRGYSLALALELVDRSPKECIYILEKQIKECNALPKYEHKPAFSFIPNCEDKENDL